MDDWENGRADFYVAKKVFYDPKICFQNSKYAIENAKYATMLCYATELNMQNMQI